MPQRKITKTKPGKEMEGGPLGGGSVFRCGRAREGLRREVAPGPRPEQHEEGSHAGLWREGMPVPEPRSQRCSEGRRPVISRSRQRPRHAAPASQP